MFKSNFIITLVLAALVTASCVQNPNSPGREFIPDMSRYKAYEGYNENPGEAILPQGMNAQKPPVNSISQTAEIYPYPNNIEGYEAAGVSYFNEFSFAQAEITGEGKRLFAIYCSVCHGDKGDGVGHLTTLNLAMGGGFPQPPSYFREDILALPEGKMYHSVMYGKGLMGSYATQLDHRERWLVLSYVQSLQDAYIAKQAATAAAEQEQG